MTRYDPHPQAHDDARSTPSGFTTGPSAAQNGSGVPEEGGGLREALERLLEFPNWTYIDGELTAVLLPEDLRAVLAAHPTDAPEAPEPRGDVVEEATQVLYDVHGAEPHIKAHALADAGLLASTSSTRAALDEDNARLTRERDRARDERDEAQRERDELQANANRDADEWVKAERERDELEAEVRVQRTEKWRVIGAMREDLDKAEAEVERLAESARTAWAVHSEHVEMMNRLLLHVQAVADERLNAAEARASRYEDALQRVREVRNGWEAGYLPVHWKGYVADIDRALSAADRTSDAPPSDGGE